MEQPQKKRLKFILIALLIFALLSFFVSFAMSFFIDFEPLGNVALIPIKGEISVEEDGSFGSAAVSSTDIVEEIKKADAKPMIKAIVFDINSPGGSPVASKEIADAIKKANKTTVAVIREVGASGAYWAASASDYIIANEMSVTGSIGVIGSYIEFAGLLQRYNMTYQRLTSGKYKDLGDPFRPMEAEEKEILLKKISKIHDIFIKAVSENRNMPEERVREMATGEFYLGVEALDLGLIDALGDKDTAEQWLKQNLNLTEVKFAEYKKTKGLFEMLTGVLSPISFFVGKGIGSELKDVGTTRKIEIIT